MTIVSQIWKYYHSSYYDWFVTSISWGKQKKNTEPCWNWTSTLGEWWLLCADYSPHLWAFCLQTAHNPVLTFYSHWRPCIILQWERSYQTYPVSLQHPPVCLSWYTHLPTAVSHSLMVIASPLYHYKNLCQGITFLSLFLNPLVEFQPLPSSVPRYLLVHSGSMFFTWLPVSSPFWYSSYCTTQSSVCFTDICLSSSLQHTWTRILMIFHLDF